MERDLITHITYSWVWKSSNSDFASKGRDLQTVQAKLVQGKLLREGMPCEFFRVALIGKEDFM